MLASTEATATSRDSAGEEIQFPVGECRTRNLGNMKDVRTVLSIGAPESLRIRFKLFSSGLKSVYPSERFWLFDRSNTRFFRSIFNFIKDGGIQWSHS